MVKCTFVLGDVRALSVIWSESKRRSGNVGDSVECSTHGTNVRANDLILVDYLFNNIYKRLYTLRFNNAVFPMLE